MLIRILIRSETVSDTREHDYLLNISDPCVNRSRSCCCQEFLPRWRLSCATCEYSFMLSRGRGSRDVRCCAAIERVLGFASPRTQDLGQHTVAGACDKQVFQPMNTDQKLCLAHRSIFVLTSQIIFRAQHTGHFCVRHENHSTHPHRAGLTPD